MSCRKHHAIFLTLQPAGKFVPMVPVFSLSLPSLFLPSSLIIQKFCWRLTKGGFGIEIFLATDEFVISILACRHP
jgi:hypothetical protein